MWRRVLVATGILFCFAGVLPARGADTAQSSGSSQEQLAVAAAENWLSNVDKGRYGLSWDDASSYFKLMVEKRRWSAEISAARQSLGKLVSRQCAQKRYTQNLPGAPDGEYYVIGFQTVFSEKAEALETVTLKKEKNGQWRVAGYYIR